MTELSIGIITGELALAAAEADGPASQWFKVTPRGRQTTRDGRSFDFDPETLAARFASDAVEIPIDTDHSTVLRGNRGETPSTIGWATKLEARADGLYAKPKWLDSGKAVLSAQTHRYVSPSVYPDDAGKTVWLHSIALVSAPALAMPALAAAQEAGKAITILGAIASSLGIPKAGDQAAFLAAIESLRGNAVSKAVHETALAALSQSDQRLETLTSDLRKREVDQLIEGALKATKILPFERDHYAELCATDGGLATVKVLLSQALPRFGPSLLEGRSRPGVGREQTGHELARQATAFRDQQARAGVKLTHAEAVRLLEQDRP